jgi:hypothetical protein
MASLWYRRLAPVMDTLCIAVFILVGKDRHHYDHQGLDWFLTVFWPLAVGWLVGALVTRVYTRDDRWYLRLLGTLAVAVGVGGVLRGAFTNRTSFSVFTVVAFVFLALTTFGWRVVWRGVGRVRGAAPAQ